MKAAVDRFGRILIPKRIRDDLGLEPGSELTIEECDGELRLVPVTGEPGLVVKEGVMIYGGAASGDVVGTVETVRRERSDQIRRRTPR